MHFRMVGLWLSVAGSLAAQVSLFDGVTLRGWSVADGPESAFSVQERAIVGSPSGGFPAWLRSDKEYENFELELEFFVKGWTDGGVYLHAPLHGHRSRSGFKISLFHQQDKEPRTNSMGSIFPVVAPRLVNVRNQGEWNHLRIRMEWPQLTVWSNGEVIHNLNVETVPELRHRLRRGYLGLETLSYPLQFRNLRIQELASKEKWEALYEQPRDLEKWTLTEPHARTPARFGGLGAVLRADGLGNLTTKAKYGDFEMRMYVRGSRHHNGGVLFRSRGGRERYEIQLHDVEESHYPTGSLYGFERARYPRIEAEEWYLFQMVVEGARCLVRINGETVMEYDKLENLEPGWIELQAHDAGRWIEYKQVLVKPR